MIGSTGEGVSGKRKMQLALFLKRFLQHQKKALEEKSRQTILFTLPLTNQNDFLESMAEAAKSVSDYENHGENMIYISVMNHLSVDCDCDSSPAEPDMHDIGILANVTFEPGCRNNKAN